MRISYQKCHINVKRRRIIEFNLMRMSRVIRERENWLVEEN